METVELQATSGHCRGARLRERGRYVCGVFYVLGGLKSLGRNFSLYATSGALSGVSTAAIVIPLVTWFVLARRWNGRSVDFQRAGSVAIVLLLLGLVLTFPPVARWFFEAAYYCRSSST